MSNNREGMEERTRDPVEGDEALAVALGTTMQRIRVVPCSVTELHSASICPSLSISSKMYSGASDKVLQ